MQQGSEQAEKSEERIKKIGTRTCQSRNSSVSNADPRILIRELALMGYRGKLVLKQKKSKVIEYEGHKGMFEYVEEYVIDLANFI